MKIVHIFGTDISGGLYAAHFPGEEMDAFSQVFEDWGDVELLEAFFEANKENLSFWDSTSVEDAVKKTLTEAENFEDKLLELAEKRTPGPTLKSVFKPLYNLQYRPEDLQKSKAHGPEHKSWLRVYAICISDTCFVVTGGGIKLTKTMEESEHLRQQLMRLEQVKTHLQFIGTTFEDAIYELTQEEDEF